MKSQTEIRIEELEEYIDNCKWFPLSTVKIVVYRDDIERMLRELRTVCMTERRGSVETEILIEKLETYIGQCKFYPMSTTKIVVSRDEVDAMLRELRMVSTTEKRGAREKVVDKDFVENLKEKQIRRLMQGASLAQKHCEKPDMLEGFERGLSAALEILSQQDEEKIVGAAAFCRKGISSLAGAKREDWTDMWSSQSLPLPDANWIVK